MFEKLIDSINDRVPVNENEYLGDDGLLHCSVCHQKVQTEVEVFGTKRIVRCICECQVKERQAYEEEQKRRELDKIRMVCFGDSNMIHWTFDNAEDTDRLEVGKRYVENFRDFKRDGMGLLLYGSVGTGKTFLSACISNALIDKGYRVFMTDFTSLTNKIQGMYDDKQEYIDSLNRFDLLIIDDLGVERKTEYMQENVYNVINTRYKSGLPMIITTNLTAEELKKPQDIAYQRIYDRILERCHPVKVEGSSKRRDRLKSTFSSMQQKLGLE